MWKEMYGARSLIVRDQFHVRGNHTAFIVNTTYAANGELRFLGWRLSF